MSIIQSQRRPEFADMLDSEVLDLYVKTYNARKAGVNYMTDNELDYLDSKLFAIDDELCARDLDLPC